MEFKVALDVFSGPLDLLLHLVKRHEVDVTAVPIAKIAGEFLAYVEALEALAIDQVGEFIDLASVLVEIKARAVVPHPEEQAEEPVEQVREDLVQRLLEYKQYRDAAVMLEDRARHQEQRFPRLAEGEPVAGGQPAPVTIGDVQVWDLVGALGRVLRRSEARKPRRIVHDDTPIEVHIERVEAAVAERGTVAFTSLFEDPGGDGMPRSRVVGIFLAVLELVRRGRLATRQERLFDEIWLAAASRPAAALESSA